LPPVGAAAKGAASMSGPGQEILELQRSAGNTAVAKLIQRQPASLRNLAAHRAPLSVQRDASGQGDDVVKDLKAGPLRDWRANANLGVGEAVHGSLEQQIQAATAFNEEAWAGAILGNVIWALASFATGGAAFAISLAGIAVGAASAVPQGGTSKKTHVAEIEEKLYQQLDRVQDEVLKKAKERSDAAKANGYALTLDDVVRQTFAPGQLTDSAPAQINAEQVRAAYRKSAEELFATIAAEVDPIGDDIDVSGPDPFVKSTSRVRLIYIRDLGYAIAHRPRAGKGWEFMNFVSPAMVDAAKIKAKSSGEGPVPTVEASTVFGLPVLNVVPLPVPSPP
jgi:hypothetical protein